MKKTMKLKSLTLSLEDDNGTEHVIVMPITPETKCLLCAQVGHHWDFAKGQFVQNGKNHHVIQVMENCEPMPIVWRHDLDTEV